MSKNFYKVVKAELLPKLIVSPRINLEPVVYSFILSPYSENILKIIDKIPGFLRRDIKRFYYISHQILQKLDKELVKKEVKVDLVLQK